MQRILLIIGIVIVTVFSTACVNKFAVQELNNNAKIMMSEGKIDDAIARLESGIDLDETVFETHYNLAVAYIEKKDYEKALKYLDNVEKLNPDFADTYYSRAVVLEDKAVDIENGEKDKVAENEDDNAVPKEKKPLTEDEKMEICKNLEAAIDNYNKYLSKDEKSKDKDKISQKIEELNQKLRQYSTEQNSPAE
jgi:tetratricopeptide (TPR) repeat protein